jgi:ribosomal protein S18 acetylase RimI-like enzyme
MRPGHVFSRFRDTSGRAFTLRCLRAADLGPLLEFANDIAREKKENPGLGVISFDSPVTAREEKKFLARTLDGLRNGGVVGVAAFDGRRLVGNCDISRRTALDERHAGVLGIVVLDGYRGRGLGRALMEMALAEARRVGVTLVELQVFANNYVAVALYERLGFKKVGTVPGKFIRRGQRIDEVKMYKVLGGGA